MSSKSVSYVHAHMLILTLTGCKYKVVLPPLKIQKPLEIPITFFTV